MMESSRECVGGGGDTDGEVEEWAKGSVFSERKGLGFGGGRWGRGGEREEALTVCDLG